MKSVAEQIRNTGGSVRGLSGIAVDVAMSTVTTAPTVAVLVANHPGWARQRCRVPEA